MSIFEIAIPGIRGDVDGDQLLFLSKVKIAILSNVENARYGVQDLSDSLSLSTSQLNRKLTAVTSYTAASLIRYYKMELAMRLLKETWLPISEVAGRAGYEEHTNFCRLFKQQFNQTPTEVRAGNKESVLSTSYPCQSPFIARDIFYLESLIKEYSWMAQVIQIIIRNIGNSHFSSKELADEMCMSVSQLNRKLNQMISISSHRLILNSRLQYAAELLISDHESSITSVALQSGFFDHPHLTRAFKTAFGQTPSAYRGQMTLTNIAVFVLPRLQMRKNDNNMP